MKRSRTSHARDRRALPPKRAEPERKPTGGGRFFRAYPRGADVPDVEHIRDVFRRVLAGTRIGQRLGGQA